MIDDQRELGVEPMRYLVGLLRVVVGHICHGSQLGDSDGATRMGRHEGNGSREVYQGDAPAGLWWSWSTNWGQALPLRQR